MLVIVQILVHITFFITVPKLEVLPKIWSFTFKRLS